MSLKTRVARIVATLDPLGPSQGGWPALFAEVRQDHETTHLTILPFRMRVLQKARGGIMPPIKVTECSQA